jgi:hypothetical protein
MAVSQRDKDLWNASKQSLSDFGLIFDPNNQNANKTLTEYKRYKGISNISDLDSSSSVSSTLSNLNPVTKIGNFISSGIATQEQTGTMPTQMLKISDATKDMFNFLTNMKSPLDLVTGGFKLLAGQAELYLTQQTELLGIINKEAGLTGKLSEDLRNELTEANIPLTRLGIEFAELAKSQASLITSTGKFIGLNRETWSEAGAAATAYVGSLSQLVAMYPQFEKVGIGAGEVAKQIVVAGNRTISLGLQSQKVTSELNQQLSRLNEYGFKNGVQGLVEMVRKSTEFRMNMESVFKIAEDVFDPDKAINLSANLQAIGGAIGDFNDPLKLMYMATNDVEGLQDALVGVAGSLATYNEEQGRFEITGVNLRRAKALASELGISYNELAQGAISAAERSSAATAMMASGLDLDDDTKRFLTNISTMKDGQMTIQLQGDEMRKIFGTNEIALENLTSNQLEQLKKYQDEFKSLSPEDIVKKQATSVENIARDVNFLLAIARVQAAKQGDKFLTDVKKMLGYDPDDLIKTSRKLADEGASMMGYTNTDKTNAANKPQSVNTPVTQLETLKPLTVDNKPKQTTETQSESSSTSTTKVDVTISSNNTVVDAFARAMINDPTTIDSFKNAMLPLHGEYTNV